MARKAHQAADCCCCMKDVKIENVKEIDGKHPTREGQWRGIEFSVVITLDYQKGAKQDCNIEWYEKADPTADIPWENKTDWVDLSKIVKEKTASGQSLPPKKKERRGWNFRDKPCPGGEVVELEDPPALKKGGKVAKRTLWIAIRVQSGSDCPQDCKTWIAYTVINLSADAKPTHGPVKEADAKDLPWAWGKEQVQDFLP
jgi:hypothetical protein